MQLTLNDIVQFVAIIMPIIGLATALVKLMIINPLQAAIAALKDAVSDVKDILTHLAEEQKNIDKRLVAVESSSKSAHHRIDGIEERMNGHS